MLTFTKNSKVNVVLFPTTKQERKMHTIRENFKKLRTSLDSLHLYLSFYDVKLNGYLWDIYENLSQIERMHMKEFPHYDNTERSKCLDRSRISRVDVNDHITLYKANIEDMVNCGLEAMATMKKIIGAHDIEAMNKTDNKLEIHSDFSRSKMQISLILNDLTHHLELNPNQEIDINNIEQLVQTTARDWKKFYTIYMDRIQKMNTQFLCLANMLNSVLPIITNRSIYYGKDYEAMLHFNWEPHYSPQVEVP